jgi:hypothetical protein
MNLITNTFLKMVTGTFTLQLQLQWKLINVGAEKVNVIKLIQTYQSSPYT